MKKELMKIIHQNDSEHYMDKQKKDIWTSLNPSQKAEIQKGIAELEKGKRISFEVILKNIS